MAVFVPSRLQNSVTTADGAKGGMTVDDPIVAETAHSLFNLNNDWI